MTDDLRSHDLCCRCGKAHNGLFVAGGGWTASPHERVCLPCVAQMEERAMAIGGK